MSTSSKLPQIIGLSGSFASGKDTLSNALVKDFGYTHVSTSDIVREVAMRERGSIERPVLHDVANAHRHTDGAGYFAELALRGSRPIVISGIRSLGEAKVIKAAGGIIVFVDAPVEVRYERVKSRNRDSEVDLSLDAFQANEAKEWYGGPSDADFNLRQIKHEADVVIENVMAMDDFVSNSYQTLGLTTPDNVQ